MLHHTLEGTHYEMGLQLGASLARRDCFLLNQVPFPLTAVSYTHLDVYKRQSLAQYSTVRRQTADAGEVALSRVLYPINMDFTVSRQELWLAS